MALIDGWITVTPDSGESCDGLGVTVSVSPNPTTSSRNGYITFVNTETEETFEVLVTQYGNDGWYLLATEDGCTVVTEDGQNEILIRI